MQQDSMAHFTVKGTPMRLLRLCFSTVKVQKVRFNHLSRTITSNISRLTGDRSQYEDSGKPEKSSQGLRRERE